MEMTKVLTMSEENNVDYKLNMQSPIEFSELVDRSITFYVQGKERHWTWEFEDKAKSQTISK